MTGAGAGLARACFGTGSVAHLRENLAAERIALDDEALRTPWRPLSHGQMIRLKRREAITLGPALYGTPASLGAAAAWIGGLLAVFIPLSVWRYRRIS